MADVRLTEPEWRARAAAHAARVDELTAEHRARRDAGRRHPVDDFLWNYYGHAPAKLRRWHPGAGVVLEGGAADAERAAWAYMTTTSELATGGGEAATGGEDGLHVDVPAFLAARGRAVGFVRRLLEATLSRPIHTGCFGLHEWAMVYRDPDAPRHEGYPLRLGQAGTDAVLEASTLRCTHFDATRFFTTHGLPRNTLTPVPTRDLQVDQENPGCVHAGMDLYKWAFKLTPAIPSELLADAFELARALRTLDMQASPYDLASLGYPPVPIETPDGRHEYATRQRALAEQANAIRRRLLRALDELESPSVASGQRAC